jgi:hypothetical protein
MALYYAEKMKAEVLAPHQALVMNSLLSLGRLVALSTLTTDVTLAAAGSPIASDNY